MSKLPFKTDLPVLLPVTPPTQSEAFQIRFWHGFALFGICMISSEYVFADDAEAQASAFSTLIKWMPLLLSGFFFNIIISFCAMALGTIVGTALGLGQISLMPAIKGSSWFVTQFFRNAPWLVLLFFAMFLLPFEFNLGFVVIPFPDWVKAIIGLSLPVMANVSEVVRGAIASLPSGQWEAAESLAYTRRQTLWLVILPQCVKRMLPPWMNLYSILTMATVLASVVGVSEVMTLTGEALAAEGGRTDLLAPFYSFILLIFFIYCYPIARYTVYLEKKFAVKT
ncbi:MAG: amino acid ABC transporter permease [Pseudomonadota bacterium]